MHQECTATHGTSRPDSWHLSALLGNASLQFSPQLLHALHSFMLPLFRLQMNHVRAGGRLKPPGICLRRARDPVGGAAAPNRGVPAGGGSHSSLGFIAALNQVQRVGLSYVGHQTEALLGLIKVWTPGSQSPIHRCSDTSIVR